MPEQVIDLGNDRRGQDQARVLPLHDRVGTTVHWSLRS
jgi:hypothetical protein